MLMSNLITIFVYYIVYYHIQYNIKVLLLGAAVSTILQCYCLCHFTATSLSLTFPRKRHS